MGRRALLARILRDRRKPVGDASAQGQALPTYSVHAGVRDATLALLAVVPLDRRWSVQSVLKDEVLLGDG
jgi:hypothetical protein